MSEVPTPPPPTGSDGGETTVEVQARTRTLVLCFDGTAGEFDNDNTNVIKFFSLLTKDPNVQLCYYQPGIGTWFKPGIVSPLLEWFAKIMDLAIAWYLDEHVLDGYRFIMQNYRVGDKICLFGFSRGAYTARALAGMLHKIGLLPRDNDAQLPFAYKLYQREDADGLVLCDGFKKTFCQDVSIEFVGVWDTVASVGVIMGRSLPFTNSNSSIRTFRHALSLDERRARFRPNLYHRIVDPPSSPVTANRTGFSLKPIKSSPSNSSSGSSSTPVAAASSSPPGNPKLKTGGFLKRAFGTNGQAMAVLEENGKSPLTPMSPVSDQVEPVDDVLEVWFSGCHSDIGGGAVQNDAPNSLANVTLRWMVRQVLGSGCLIQFDLEALERENIKQTSDADSSVNDDSLDALQPMDDELKKNVMWWVLEIVPMRYMWQDSKGVWHKTWKWNLGKGRKIEEDHPNFHETVKDRMQSSLGYIPKAQWGKGNEVYVR